MRARKKRQPRGVVDTSVLVAGISAFRRTETSTSNPSASLIREWITNATFVWLVSKDILDEYKTVLTRLRVSPSIIGRAINLISDDAESVAVSKARIFRPILETNPSVAALSMGMQILLLPSIAKTFPNRS